MIETVIGLPEERWERPNGRFALIDRGHRAARRGSAMMSAVKPLCNHYDATVDAATSLFRRHARSARIDVLDERRMVDYDDHGRVAFVEVLDASRVSVDSPDSPSARGSRRRGSAWPPSTGGRRGARARAVPRRGSSPRPHRATRASSTTRRLSPRSPSRPTSGGRSACP